MDFALYGRVLWRFRLLVVLGLLLAMSLATLSMVRVSKNGLDYRETELWASTTRVGVTQQGFPWGRLFAQQPTAAEQALVRGGIPIANPDRFNTLAVLYAELATSDPVLRTLRRGGPISGKVIATPLRAAESNTMLPLIDITAVSVSPLAALTLSERSADALATYLRQQQTANKVPAADRVVIEPVLRARRAQIFQPRSKTMPLVIFLAVMFATVGLVFILQNLRPSNRTPGAQADAELRGPAQRRTA